MQPIVQSRAGYRRNSGTKEILWYVGGEDHMVKSSSLCIKGSRVSTSSSVVLSSGGRAQNDWLSLTSL